MNIKIHGRQEGTSAEKIEHRVAQLNAANEIIAKLPKCNRLVDAKDGVVQDVPIAPGKLVWLIPSEITRVFGEGISHPTEVIVYGITECGIIEVECRGLFSRVVSANCYDSPEAAEFALKQAGRKK